MQLAVVGAALLWVGLAGCRNSQSTGHQAGAAEVPEPPPQVAADTGAPCRSTAVKGLRFYVVLGFSIMGQLAPPMSHRVPGCSFGPFVSRGQSTGHYLCGPLQALTYLLPSGL